MKNQIIALLLAFCGLLTLTACQDSKAPADDDTKTPSVSDSQTPADAPQDDTQKDDTKQDDTQKDDTKQDDKPDAADPTDQPDGQETPDEPADQPDGQETPDEPADQPDGQETPAQPAPGYVLTYNLDLFQLEQGDHYDTYTYQSSDTLDAPIYVRVQCYGGQDAQTILDNLIQQSGQDGLTPMESHFGADSVAAQSLVIQKEVNGVEQLQLYYVVPAESGTVVVEVVGYIGMPEAADGALESILATFSLRDPA